MATVTSVGQQGTQCQGYITIDTEIEGKKDSGRLCENVWIDAGMAYEAGQSSEASKYTHVGRRELGYMDHGNFEPVGNYDWYYKP